jgi:two-component system phosphate regulon response regulator PhoB
MKTKILILEDDSDIQELISLQFNLDQFELHIFEESQKALKFAQNNRDIALFLVDWMLPGNDSGIVFLKECRLIKEFKETPFIMITALSQPENIVEGLDAGANDYITKPFDLKILNARIRAQMRGKNLTDTTHVGQKVVFKNLSIDKTRYEVFVNNKQVHLTTTEFKILELISSKPGHVFTRSQLLKEIQGENIFVTGRTIDTHIAGLRKKIESASELIETIRGIGYRFKDE